MVHSAQTRSIPTEQKDEPVSIDLEVIATAFRRAAYTQWSNTLIGNAPKCVLDTHDQMKNPRIGDWVIEASTMGGGRNPDSSDLDGVGILEEVAEERIEMEWDEAENGPHPTEGVYYIRTMDGRRFRWHNASIIAVPTYRPLLVRDALSPSTAGTERSEVSSNTTQGPRP